MRLTAAAVTGIALGLILLIAAGITWYVLEQRDAREEAAAKAAHPLRIVSSGTASSSLFDDAGNRVSLATYAESWTIITSWATWCPTCQKQLAAVAAIEERYGDQGLVAIAYNRTEPVRTIEAYTADNPLPQNLVLVRDTTDALFQQFDGYTMPETIIVSPNGKVTHHWRGSVSEATIQRAVIEALGE